VVECVIPTFKNEYWLKRCLQSLADAKMPELGTVHIVDNGGDFYESNHFVRGLTLRVYKPGANLGWTDGLLHAMPNVRSEFVMFLNDDTEFERMPDRLGKLLEHFKDPDVAAVGPATGVAMGRQALAGPDLEYTKLLIGFCMILRRSTLEEVGGVRGVPGDMKLGDDVDLCIRLNKAGKKMLIDRRVFVYHHAFKTGTRLYGSARRDGGWNSLSMVSDTVQKLILEYGAEAVVDTIGENGPAGSD